MQKLSLAIPPRRSEYISESCIWGVNMVRCAMHYPCDQCVVWQCKLVSAG